MVHSSAKVAVHASQLAATGAIGCAAFVQLSPAGATAGPATVK